MLIAFVIRSVSLLVPAFLAFFLSFSWRRRLPIPACFLGASTFSGTGIPNFNPAGQTAGSDAYRIGERGPTYQGAIDHIRSLALLFRGRLLTPPKLRVLSLFLFADVSCPVDNILGTFKVGKDGACALSYLLFLGFWVLCGGTVGAMTF